jgi:hypothetical protein
MGQTTGFLTKSLTATTAIPARTLVKYGAVDGSGVPAVDSSAFIAGVSSEIDTAVGERASVFMNGNIADVLYGGTVGRGDALTADAQGRAITTTTTGAKIVGFAEVSGSINDIGSVIISPGIL